MQYLIIGTGGTGGALGAFLARGGHSVTFIARGAHLEAMQKNGLTVHSGIHGDFTVQQPDACTAEQYSGVPDVAFVCVKGYSLGDAAALLRRCATPQTVIIPILNIFGTGELLQQELPGLHVLDGCIYITSYIASPGVIAQGGKLFRVIFGERDGSLPPVLETIAAQLRDCGIRAEPTADVRRLCFQKYSLISAMATAGAYYDAPTGELWRDPEKRATYTALVQEIEALAAAMGIPFAEDMVGKNLHYLETAAPDTTASMQKDMAKGRQSEVDGLVYEPVRLGLRYGVPTPTFLRCATKLGYAAK